MCCNIKILKNIIKFAWYKIQVQYDRKKHIFIYMTSCLKPVYGTFDFIDVTWQQGSTTQ